MNLSVIGLGKLGSPLAAVFASKGHHVIGIDLNREFVNKLNSGIAPVNEPGLQELITANSSRIRASSSYSDVVGSDATFLIVPTPTQEDGFFTNQYLLRAAEQLGTVLKEKKGYHLVVITSTVMPGSTGGEIKSALESSSQKKVGEDLGLCYSPEFIALGSVIRNMLYPDLILIGESDEKAGEMLKKISLSACESSPPVMRLSLESAEVAKLAVNTYVTMKISFANMLSELCQEIPGADVDSVTNAMGLDSRIGSKYLRSATAFGGPCFPRDNIALAALGKKLGARTDLAEATQEINRHQTERTVDFLKRFSKSKEVAILGLSYKSGTYVVEESQGIRIANQLTLEGFNVIAYDPLALKEAEKVIHEGVSLASSVEECLKKAETLLIVTPWPEFVSEITPEVLKKLPSKKAIVDCWRIFPKQAYQEVCDLYYLGCGDFASEPLVTH